MKKTSEILSRASELLDQKGWCQGTLVNDQGNMCMMGALSTAMQEDRLTENSPESDDVIFERRISEERAVVQALSLSIYGANAYAFDVICTNPIPEWNDRPERSVEDVKLAFKKAINYAENTGD